MRLCVVAGGRVGRQTVTKISAGDERDRSPNFFGCASDALAKTEVIVIGKKAVPQRDHAAIPTVALQEIQRHRRAMIEIEPLDSDC